MSFRNKGRLVSLTKQEAREILINLLERNGDTHSPYFSMLDEQERIAIRTLVDINPDRRRWNYKKK